MYKDLEKLDKIFRKTDGYCHLCHKRLSFKNHGKIGTKGAWHVEHSIPKYNNGSDHLNNLYPSCIKCNIEKGISSTSIIRKKNGVNRAPLSKKTKMEIQQEYTAIGAIIGGAIGLIGGPLGIAFGAIVGGVVGSNNSPSK